MDKQAALYVMASQRNGTLYVGVTSSLRQRVWQHKNEVGGQFTREYGVHLLVYYELYDDMVCDLTRETTEKVAPSLEA